MRFCARMGVLLAFAAFGGIGFGKSLAALLAMSALLCAVLATARREAVFPRALNHWDEAVACGALFFLSVALGGPAPI
jgi:hypothetical protein